MEKEKAITLGDLFKALKKNWLVIVILTILCGGVGTTYAVTQTHVSYKTTTKLLVAVENKSTTTPDGKVNYNESLTVINSYGEIVKEDVVLKPAAEKLKAEGLNIDHNILKSKLTVTVSNISLFVTIDVVHSDKEETALIANTVAEELIEQSKNNVALKTLGAIVEQTTPSSLESVATINPNKKLYVAISFLAGLVLGAGYSFVREFLSNKFKTREEIEGLTNLDTLGLLVDVKVDKKDVERHRARINEDESYSELYNKLATSIRYSKLENPYKVIEFTSTEKSELKTTTVCNLARSYALNKKKVVIIDLDTRSPSVHKVFSLEKENGLTEYIEGNLSKDQIVKHTAHKVDVITPGAKVVNPVVVLESNGLKTLIEELRKEYDYVLIDTPPVLAYSDALIISKIVDGVIFNIAINQATRKSVVESLQALNRVGANVIGTNITKLPANELSKKYNYYYYYKNYKTTEEK